MLCLGKPGNGNVVRLEVCNAKLIRALSVGELEKRRLLPFLAILAGEETTSERKAIRGVDVGALATIGEEIAVTGTMSLRATALLMFVGRLYTITLLPFRWTGRLAICNAPPGRAGEAMANFISANFCSGLVRLLNVCTELPA